VVEEVEGNAFRRAVERRAAGEPLAHVTGTMQFRHLTLASDRRALIPRPETEGLVDLALARVTEGCAADIGTGSGCIALALAAEGAFELVVGIDRSPDALALARWNREWTGLPVALVQGDLCAPLAPRGYDLIVSNPPYLTEAEHAALDPAVRDWEPAEALASGADGLDATRRLLAQALRPLRPGGWLVIELDGARAAQAEVLAREAGWEFVEVHEDLFGRARYLAARRSE
jgi:release factor glutamine methyltransferase